MNETKKIWLIIGLILVSVIVGFYDRIQPHPSPSRSFVTRPSVMVITINGVISMSDVEWNGGIVSSITSQLNDAASSKSVKAVVLRINSPGGTVGATQEITNAIHRFKSKTGKPIVASIMDIGASGAYWIALSTDYIFAHPGSIVGSLGVITQTLDLTQIPEKYGVDVRTYKAGVHKDLLNPWRTPTKDDSYLVNKMLKTVHRQFRNALIESRNVSKNQAAILADGRIYAGEDAVSENLVDELGGLHAAVQYAGSLANVSQPSIVYPNNDLNQWMSFLKSTVQSISPLSTIITQPPIGIR